jgi:two-component system response regulator AtoC
MTRPLGRELLTPREFDARVEDETERCVRYDRSLAVVAIEVVQADEATLSRVKQRIVSKLRSLDVATRRKPGRFEILVAECTKAEAGIVASRLAQSLRDLDVNAKLGIAVYPGDAPSAHTLSAAATMAMQAAAVGEVGEAGAGARRISLGAHEVVIAEPAVVRLFDMIERVALAELPVLVRGETGSGKELVAEAVHRWGPRANKPLVKLNCAAVPENLLESELFGYERGAFSGADRAKPGLFEEVDGGTIFLDEIGDMPLPLQAKLLRVLEDQRVRRVGALKDKQIDIRIVAATHRDLGAAAAEGRFREDLFYRLGAIVLYVPPLRERTREIPLLVEKFVSDACRRANRDPIAVRDDALRCLKAYGWPGNIRELRHVITAAVVMCDSDEITVHHLPAHLVRPSEVAVAAPPRQLRRHDTIPAESIAEMRLNDEVRALERERIRQALEACGGNQTKAAEYLGMPRRTLVSKLAALDVERPRKKTPTREP